MKKFALFLLCVVAAIGIGVAVFTRTQPRARIVLPGGFQPFPLRMTRPHGMAPIAFEAFIRACNNAGINPDRIGQTIGDDPRSVGYHKRDGILAATGERIEYSAAVDLGVWDLSKPQIARFCAALAKQGFAAFYRHEGKWKGNEHIHAIYALLPMKIQLRRQVRRFLRERSSAGLPPLRWERKLRRVS